MWGFIEWVYSWAWPVVAIVSVAGFIVTFGGIFAFALYELHMSVRVSMKRRLERMNGGGNDG
jgi:hypothetical protein